MTKKAKIITGVVAGVTVLGGIGAVTNKDKLPNSDYLNTTTTTVYESTTTFKSIETTIDEIITSTQVKQTETEKTKPDNTEPDNTEPPKTSNVITTSKPLEIITQAPPKANTVYIAATGNGKKFHANPNCSGMAGNVIEMTKDQAYAAGYTPCQKNTCYG